MSLRPRRSLVVILAVMSLLPVGAARGQTQASAAPPAPPVVTAVANDNRTPAGMLKDGVLTLHLVALVARWQPEGQGPNDPVRVVQTFAEEGKAPQIPGPLVRVPEGTEIRMTVRTTLPGAPLRLYGAMPRPGALEAFAEIAQGASKELRFGAGDPGPYCSRGSTSGPP